MEKLIPEGFTKRTEAVKFQPNLPGTSTGDNNSKNSANNNRSPKYPAQAKRQTVFFDPLAAKQNSQTEQKDFIFPAKSLGDQTNTDNQTKVTILCVKRKRDESTLDSIVLEEQRPTKRQMTQLADAMQVVSLRDKQKQFEESQPAKKFDEKERKFFRYFTTIEQDEVKIDASIESRLESLKSKRMDGFITHSEDIPRSMDEKTTQSIQKHHQASKAARFAQISKLRNITKTASPSANLNLLELVTHEKQQPRQLTINGLPVVRSKAQVEAEEKEKREFVVDYYVYESSAPKERLKTHQAVVPVESFDETLMDNVLVDDDNEYDSDDSDDSQNRNRDYTDTPPDSEDEGQESIEFTSSEEESHGKFLAIQIQLFFLVLIIFFF
jgi:hypothetical protein